MKLSGWVRAQDGRQVNLNQFDVIRRVETGSQEDVGMGLHWIAERYERWPLGGEPNAAVVILLGDDEWAMQAGFLR